MFLWKYWSDQGEAQAVDENSTMVETLLLSSLPRVDLGNSGIDWRINPHTRHNENMRSFDTEGTGKVIDFYLKYGIRTANLNDIYGHNLYE